MNPGAGRDLNLGRPIALPRGTPRPRGARQARLPSTRRRCPTGRRVPSLVYAGPPEVLVQTFRARATPFIQKTVGSADHRERLTVDGAPAFWITGSHGFAFQAPDGNVVYEEQRLADRTLLVERGGGLTARRGRGSAATRAVAIARSIE